MPKAALLVPVLAPVLSTMSNVAAAADDPNQNTRNFLRDAMNPYAATAQPSSGMHHMHMHHMHMHHMHMHRHHMHHHRHHMKHGKM
jgi:hypothetical protein